jgi:hypothetical protein
MVFPVTVLVFDFEEFSEGVLHGYYTVLCKILHFQKNIFSFPLHQEMLKLCTNQNFGLRATP